MACHLVGTKPLSELMLEYCWMDPLEQASAKILSRLKKKSIQEIAFESVFCEMAGNLSRRQYVKYRYVSRLVVVMHWINQNRLLFKW